MRIFTAAIILTLLRPALGADDQMMSAIRFHQFGDAGVLKLERAPRPTPGEGEMLVRVHAAAVNPIDWKIRSGAARGLAEKQLPYTPGFDLSGTVERLGADVTQIKPGEEVFAMLDLRRGGAYAEYAIVKATEAALKPSRAKHTEAAAVPLVTLTAWQALFDNAKLEKGQTILVHGGAGGVGSMAVQLAKWKGAKVIATASKENLDFLREIGADEVIDYRAQKFEDVARNVDVVLDPIGGDTRTRSFAVLKPGGVLVSIVGPPSQELAKQHNIRAVSMLVHPDSQQLAQIGKLIDAGDIRPVVTHVFPLSDAAKAHQQSETGHTRGKIVLEIGR